MIASDNHTFMIVFCTAPDISGFQTKIPVLKNRDF